MESGDRIGCESPTPNVIVLGPGDPVDSSVHGPGESLILVK